MGRRLNATALPSSPLLRPLTPRRSSGLRFETGRLTQHFFPHLSGLNFALDASYGFRTRVSRAGARCVGRFSSREYSFRPKAPRARRWFWFWPLVLLGWRVALRAAVAHAFAPRQGRRPPHLQMTCAHTPFARAFRARLSRAPRCQTPSRMRFPSKDTGCLHYDWVLQEDLIIFRWCPASFDSA